MRRERVHFVLAAAAYLVLVLWSFRAVLPDPTRLVPFPARLEGEKVAAMYRSDRRFVTATVAVGADRILRGDFALLDQPSCYPLERAGTLGEHMIGESLLGVVPHALVGEPIFTMNAVNVLSIWIAALAMYVLARFWTGSSTAAFAAGLLFAFHPRRISNPAHPFIHGNFWTPLALVAAHRLFAQRRWRDAGLLAALLCLQLTESFYQVLALFFLGGTYGVYLLVRFRRSLRELVPKLAFVAVAAATAAHLIFTPYLDTRDTWGVLQGRGQAASLLPFHYGPGEVGFVGWTGLLLGALGLADRLRGARTRDGCDPRLAFALGGVLVLWTTLLCLPTDLGCLPSPLVLLKPILPGVDAVRVPSSLRFGVFLVVAFLAAYGVVVVTERLPRRWRGVVGLLLAAAILVESFHPAVAERVYRDGPELLADAEPPPVELIELFAKAPPGAVLDIPLQPTGAFLDRLSFALLWSAYHRRPVAACYNSFRTQLLEEIERLAERLPDPRASDALHALGFRVLVLHSRPLGPASCQALVPLLKDPMRTASLGSADTPIGRIELHALSSPASVTEDGAVLRPVRPPSEPVVVPPSARVKLAARMRNSSRSTYRHPRPIEPSRLRVEWRDAAGVVRRREEATFLLPPAVGAGDVAVRELEVATPAEPGEYHVAAFLPSGAGRPIARWRVAVGPAAGAAS